MHILWALEGLQALSTSMICWLLWLMRRPACANMPCDWLNRGWLPSRPCSKRCLPWPPIASRGCASRSRFTLGESADRRTVPALAKIAERDADDRWMRTAVLSSSAERADQVAVALMANEDFLSKPAASSWLEQLATIVGARNRDAEIKRLLEAVAARRSAQCATLAVALGLGAGLQRSNRSLGTVEASATAEIASDARRVVCRRGANSQGRQRGGWRARGSGAAVGLCGFEEHGRRPGRPGRSAAAGVVANVGRARVGPHRAISRSRGD